MSQKPLEGDGAGLHLRDVTWRLCDRRGNLIDAVFHYEDGAPVTIGLYWGGEDEPGHTEDNRSGNWRSCITHVIQLVRQFCYRPKHPERRELTAHEKQRLGKSKPELKVVG